MYIHTIEYYLTIKRNEPLMHATTWMDLNYLRLISKGHIYMIPFIGHSQMTKL